ncbi:glutathione S-transferase [Litorivita sp. NS0012-18]
MAQQGLKIYDWHTGPYPARVRMALIEKGLQRDVTFVSVDLRKGEHKKPAFLAKNYSGTLPVLETADGTLIAECTAITAYLDALRGAPVLTGEGALERGLIHMMNKRAEIELLDPISVYFHHATSGLGPAVELYQNAEWGLRQRDKAIAAMHYFDELLAARRFVAVDRFSMADITVLAGLIFADLVGVAIPETCRALHMWRERMGARPSVSGWMELSRSK